MKVAPPNPAAPVSVAFNGGGPEDSGTDINVGYDGADSELGAEFDDHPWRIVREKEHPTEPMTADDALV